MLALVLMLGLSTAEIALADDTSGSAPAAGNSNQAEAKPKRERRLGKRLGKLRSRFHRKKAGGAAGASGNASGSGTGSAPQQ